MYFFAESQGRDLGVVHRAGEHRGLSAQDGICMSNASSQLRSRQAWPARPVAVERSGVCRPRPENLRP